MNIAIIIPDITAIGGAERVVFNLSRFLAKKHSITIVSLFSKDDDFKKAEFNIIHTNIRKPKSKIGNAFLRQFPPKSIIKMLNNYDLIISNNVFRNYINPHHFQTKLIDLHHLNYEESGIRFSLRKKIALIFRNHKYKLLDKLVVLTKLDEEKFRKAGLNNVTTIPNGLSFLPTQTADLNQKLVIAIGRLHFDKGHENLIKAWLKVNELFPDWKLKIYGKGPEKENLENLIAKLNFYDSVSLAGTVDNIADKIMESSVFVMSSHYEGFGMTILESMACGVPVVSFDCPTGPREILQSGKFGILAEDQNINDLADKMMILMSSYELRKEYGLKARERALDYSWDIIGPMWDNLLDTI